MELPDRSAVAKDSHATARQAGRAGPEARQSAGMIVIVE